MPAHHDQQQQQQQQPPQAQTLVIVGGVAGGASAATRARRMNEQANIILLEKDAYVSFANCGMPYYLGGEIQNRDKLIVAKPKLFQERFNIDVRTRHEAAAINREKKTLTVTDHNTNTTYELAYDKLILAPGASPIRPPIPGIQAQNVYSLRNLHDTDHIFSVLPNIKQAAIIGAGFIGLELAEQLAHRGIHVHLVEKQRQVLPLLDPEMTYPIQQALIQNKIQLHLDNGIQKIQTKPDESTQQAKATGVYLENGDLIEADAIFMAIGVAPNNQLAIDAKLPTNQQTGAIQVNPWMQTQDANIYAVGDAAEYPYGPTNQMMRVPLAGPANRAGRLAGQHAVSTTTTNNNNNTPPTNPHSATNHLIDPMQPVQGTAIVRVFDQTAAITGLSIQAAKRFNIPATSITITANHHAGYYPGAAPITLKLVYCPNTGRILGAQAVGQQGVDKRIDIIATAMHFGGTVDDLTGVDLTYAPPFGSAKDPVHMAAFAASNQRQGLYQTRPVDTDLRHDQILDVRTEQEVQNQPLAHLTETQRTNLRHIPLDQLRTQFNTLDSTKPTVVTCASGLRSYVACRILSQHHFKEVYSLSGGARVRAWINPQNITPVSD